MTGSGRFSTAVPRRFWYPACRSSDLRGPTPHAFEFLGTPLVAFRGAGGAPAVLIDRCPHRNAPLRLGRVAGDGTLRCGYHGWCFDGAGTCVAVPGLHAVPGAPNRSVAAHACTEADGFVWFWGEPDAEPVGAPRPVPPARPAGRARRTGRTVFCEDMATTMHAALENALDVPHTAFLHGGIFRGRGEPRGITAERRSLPDGVEVQYLGEPIGFGPLTLRSEHTNRTFDHWDRFLMPHTAQITYAIPGWLEITNTILHLPLDEFRTRAWFVLDYASPLPAALADPIVRLRGRAVLRQDVGMLEAQTATTRRFGGERYTSTELDLLGNAIARLLRQAVRAESGAAPDERDEADDLDGIGDDGATTVHLDL